MDAEERKRREKSQKTGEESATGPEDARTASPEGAGDAGAGGQRAGKVPEEHSPNGWLVAASSLTGTFRCL